MDSLSIKYDGLTESDINNMTTEQMREALLKIVTHPLVRTDNYYSTEMLLIDDLADIIRFRI